MRACIATCVHMSAHLPRHIVLVLVDADFVAVNSVGQLCAEVVLDAELETVRAVERDVGATTGAEYGPDRTIYVKVPPLVPCVTGRITTIRRSSELGRMRCRMQLVARSLHAWSFVCDAEWRIKSGLTWELDCLHTDEPPLTPGCVHYVVSPAVHTTAPDV